MRLVRLKPQGPGTPGTMKIYKVGFGPLGAPKFLERKFAVS